MGGSRPRRRLGRLKGAQRETLLKESHAKESHAAVLIAFALVCEFVCRVACRSVCRVCHRASHRCRLNRPHLQLTVSTAPQSNDRCSASQRFQLGHQSARCPRAAPCSLRVHTRSTQTNSQADTQQSGWWVRGGGVGQHPAQAHTRSFTPTERSRRENGLVEALNQRKAERVEDEPWSRNCGALATMVVPQPPGARPCA